MVDATPVEVTTEPVSSPAPVADTKPVETTTAPKDGEVKVVVEQPKQLSRGEREDQDRAALKATMDKAYDRAVARSKFETGEGPDPDKEKPAKGADGKFVAKAADVKAGHNQPPEETPTEKPKAAAPVDPNAKPVAIAAPQSWPKEVKAKWDKLEPDVQAYLADADRRTAREFTRAGQTTRSLEKALDSYKPIHDTIGKYADVLKGWQQSPHDTFEALMENAIELQRTPKQAIMRLARDAGVDIAALAFEHLDPNSLPPDPRVAERDTEILALRRQLAQAQNLVKADRQNLQRSQEARHEQEQVAQYHNIRGGIDELAKKLPHFDRLANDIADLMPVYVKKYGQTEKALLEAHKHAMRANDEIFQNVQTEQLKAAEAKREAERKRIAETARTANAVNVSSTPTGNTAQASLRAAQDAAYASAMRRSGQTA